VLTTAFGNAWNWEPVGTVMLNHEAAESVGQRAACASDGARSFLLPFRWKGSVTAFSMVLPPASAVARTLIPADPDRPPEAA